MRLTCLALLVALAGNTAEAAAPDPSRMMTVYLVLLKKGPAWSPEVTPASQALQEAHLANIMAMWKASKLIIAGPVEDEADLRGIFVFQAASLDEAKAWA